jgi:hypothetical protein
MNSPIQTTHAWNKEYWPTGGVEKAYLGLAERIENPVTTRI